MIKIIKSSLSGWLEGLCTRQNYLPRWNFVKQLDKGIVRDYFLLELLSPLLLIFRQNFATAKKTFALLTHQRNYEANAWPPRQNYRLSFNSRIQGVILVHSGCCSGIPYTGWLINRNLFLISGGWEIQAQSTSRFSGW